MKRRDLETELFHIGLIFMAAGTAVWVLYSFWLKALLPQVPCFFSNVIGIYCPGCGGTRAAAALAGGHFLLSVWYHPLVPYMAVVGGGFMLTQALSRLGVKYIKGWKFHNWYLYGAVLLLGCNFLIKNMLRLVWGITM